MVLETVGRELVEGETRRGRDKVLGMRDGGMSGVKRVLVLGGGCACYGREESEVGARLGGWKSRAYLEHVQVELPVHRAVGHRSRGSRSWLRVIGIRFAG